ncbi:MAG: tetratricopeptide repeat protein [Lachnospiraceae bacterium]
MGRIVRCLDTGEMKKPLYVAAAGIHLYSLEELSYFLQHFLYLIDDAFFDTELMQFLREDMNRRDLAELVVSRVSQVGPVVLAGELAFAIGDMDETEQKLLKEKVSVFQKLPDSGKKKLQADLFLEQKEYDRAAEIYVQLLHDNEQKRIGKNDEETGMIYYNLGKIHMAAFEWKAAGEALSRAYEYLHQESVLQELFELSCISPVPVCNHDIFSEIHVITMRKWQETFNRKKDRIEQEIAAKNYGDTGEAVFRKWKKDFRKISKSCCQESNF